MEEKDPTSTQERNKLPGPQADKEISECIAYYKSNATLHGLAYVANARSPRQRRAWMILLGLFGAALLVQLYHNIEFMLQFPVQEYSFLNCTSPKLKFPQVTICNENQYQRSKIIKTPMYDVFRYVNFNGSEEGIEEYIDQNAVEFHDDPGQTMDEMLLQGSWDGEPITADQFMQHRKYKVGICYTFNSDKTATRETNLRGAQTGLELLLDLQPDENTNLSKQLAMTSVGAKVVIHDQLQEPLIMEFGSSVGPGMRTDFGIKMNKFKRLPKPYPSSCARDEVKLELSNKSYSVSRCEDEHFVMGVMKKCGCFLADNGHGRSDFPVCKVRDMKCIQNAEKTMSTDFICPIPCQETTYDVTTSASYYPSPRFLPVAQRLFYNNLNFSTEKEFEEYFRRRVVAIRVFFQTLCYNVRQETASYELQNLVADVGGNLGLFLGCSLLTICELVDLLINFITIRVKRHRSQGPQQPTQAWDST